MTHGHAVYRETVPRPRHLPTTIVGGKRYDQVARALYATIARHSNDEERERLHHDALHYGFCLVDADGRRVDPVGSAAAARVITYAIGRE